MSKPRGRPPATDLLTPAEWSVVNALRHGGTNPAIAKRLGVSVDAVKYHVSNAMQKLGLNSRAQLRLWRGVAQSSALADAATRKNVNRKLTMIDRSNEAKEAQQTPEPDKLGAIVQIARTVSDIEAARRWYIEVAGLQHLYSFGKMAFFDCAGVRLMLSETEHGAKPAQPVMPESILYFRVSDIHQAQTTLLARGAVFINAPHLVHRHSDGTEEWMAFFQDHDARPLALLAQVQRSA